MRHHARRHWLRRSTIEFMVVSMTGVAAPAVSAQGTSTKATIARTFEIRAQPGLVRQFEDGYRRHLDWHARAGDRWTWYMWQVTDGERAGLYVDGTFAHAWADFDAAVDPPGDAADNAANVNPFSTRAANHAWRLLPELSGRPVDLEKSPLVMRTEYRVRTSVRDEFDGALRRLRERAGDSPYAVYELASGGDLATYVVWVPAGTWSEAGALADRVAGVTRVLAASAESARSELWRFRHDLSLCRRTESSCHATLR